MINENPITIDGNIVIVGYGSQGRAHALNLRDAGNKVMIVTRLGGPGARRAHADGFEISSFEDALPNAALVALLAPDIDQPSIYADCLARLMPPGSTLLFAHGFSIHFKRIEPRDDLDVVLFAPKGPGELVRREFAAGRGVPGLYGVQQDVSGKALARLMAYARGVAGKGTSLIETSFAEETETDLFGEQAVLCGGLKELVLAGYETLTEAGYKPEVAYFECLHELKLIVDLLYEGGLTKMHRYISSTAKFGALVSGPIVVDGGTRECMRQLLADIQSGSFAKQWVDEHERGGANFDRLLKDDLSHPIEQVGAELRSQMPWMGQADPQQPSTFEPRQATHAP